MFSYGPLPTKGVNLSQDNSLQSRATVVGRSSFDSQQSEIPSSWGMDTLALKITRVSTTRHYNLNWTSKVGYDLNKCIRELTDMHHQVENDMGINKLYNGDSK